MLLMLIVLRDGFSSFEACPIRLQ